MSSMIGIGSGHSATCVNGVIRANGGRRSVVLRKTRAGAGHRGARW